jgi:hypothetical protein
VTAIRVKLTGIRVIHNEATQDMRRGHTIEAVLKVSRPLNRFY